MFKALKTVQRPEPARMLEKIECPQSNDPTKLVNIPTDQSIQQKQQKWWEKCYPIFLWDIPWEIAMEKFHKNWNPSPKIWELQAFYAEQKWANFHLQNLQCWESLAQNPGIVWVPRSSRRPRNGSGGAHWKLLETMDGGVCMVLFTRTTN